MSLNGKYSVGILLTFVLLGSVMLYVFPLINTFTGTAEISAGKFFITRAVLWMVMAVVFLYNLIFEKQKFLLWKEQKYSFGFYIGAVVILYLLCALGGAFLNAVIQMAIHEKTSGKLMQLSSLFSNNYPLIIFTCLTAGVVEELLMRGYIQPRAEKIYNNQFTGIFLSAVLFGILHSTYGTIGQVAVPFFIGMVFAFFYRKYSNIKILIICHFMYDFISLMILNFIHTQHLPAFLTL